MYYQNGYQPVSETRLNQPPTNTPDQYTGGIKRPVTRMDSKE